MSSAVIQLLVLAAVAVFLILRLRNVLGTREGFEKPPVVPGERPAAQDDGPVFDVIEGGPDRDITDHVPEGSETAEALMAMKTIDETFHVGEFLEGARGAYEMILMAFERGDLKAIEPFLSKDVFESFAGVVDMRADKGLTVEATFVGVREMNLNEATFDPKSKLGEITVRFVGELTSVVRDEAGDIIEGNPSEIKRQRDTWTFARKMGTDDPNWQLVATGE